MVDIFSNYCTGEKACARFLTVYIEEAHANDEWWLPTSPGAEKDGKAYIAQHKTIQDRINAASAFVRDNKFPTPVICDSIENEVSDHFNAWPERLYIVEDSVVVYQVRTDLLIPLTTSIILQH